MCIYMYTYILMMYTPPSPQTMHRKAKCFRDRTGIKTTLLPVIFVRWVRCNVFECVALG